MRALKLALLAVVATLAACQDQDRAISERVKVRFAGERTPAAQVHVSTSDRIVRLEGVVISPAERDRLERVARETHGVMGVDNRLVVQAPVEVTGEEEEKEKEK